MKGSKEAKASNEFDICHSAALPEKEESVEVPRLFIWLNFFWCEAMPIFFNCFFNEIWRINDVQRLMKGFVNLVRWRLCYLLTDFDTAL